MSFAAEELKQKGNKLFKAGDFAGAEQQYTLAIQRYSKNPLLFTNRAFARLKLQNWNGAIDDCLHSIEQTGHGQNFKAFFYLAQAQIALNHPHEALSSALTAYDQAMHPTIATTASSASSIQAISALVLKCKRAKFTARERERLQRRGDVLAELEEALEKNKRSGLQYIEDSLRSGAIGNVEAEEQRSERLDEAQRKLDELRSVFAIADPANHQAKEVPDYLVDTISFEVMHDPVMTRTGHSYERAVLQEHLKGSPTDPLTREPLTIDDLRPNIALRKACDEFWESAGNWVADW